MDKQEETYYISVEMNANNIYIKFKIGKGFKRIWQNLGRQETHYLKYVGSFSTSPSCALMYWH